MGYQAEYHFPGTITEASDICSRLGGDLLFLAGGTEINSSAFSGTGSHLMALRSLPLRSISTAESGWIRIGALVTMQELIESPLVPEVLKEGARGMANRNVRDMATIGGNIGAGKSCSSLLPALIALHAQYETIGNGGTLPTGLPDYAGSGIGRGMLITHILVPGPDAGIAACYRKFSRTANDIAVVSAAVSVVPSAGSPFEKAIVAVGGLGPRVQRMTALEDELRRIQDFPDERFFLEKLQHSAKPIDDIRGSKTFKFLLAAELVREALIRASGTGIDSRGGRS